MEINFEQTMAKKSEDGLLEYVNNIDKYTPESIVAAVKELKKRGRDFSEEEIRNINSKIKSKIEAEKKEDAIWIGSWKDNFVTDPNAPELYSQRAIWGFSTFFTVIFGAVLLSANLEDKKKKWIVIAFGAFYTLGAIVVLNQLPRNTGLTFLVNAAGAIILTSIFWDKYIGKQTKFRVKPIWKPLIISIIIMIPFILALLYS